MMAAEMQDSSALMRNLPLQDRTFAPIFRMRMAASAETVFLKFDGKSFTYGEVCRKVLALARGLAELGIGRGDIVPVLLENSVDYVVCWFALQLRGATIAMVNPGARGTVLGNAISDCSPKLAICGHEQAVAIAELTSAVRAQLRHVVLVEDDSAPSGGAIGNLPSIMPLASLLRDEGPDPVVETSFQEVQTVIFTSGSTGPAKGVLLPNGHYFANACTFLRLSGLRPDDVLHTSLPLFHGIASRQGVLPSFMIGATVSLGRKFSASRFWQTVTEEAATVALLTPSMTPIIAARPEGEFDQAHSLRALYNVPHDASFEARFNVTLLAAFAITEVGAIIYSPYGERREGSVGKAHEDWELALVDGVDRVLSEPGATGELVCRPRLPYIMMQGYLNRPQAAVDAWNNLWYHTGDVMRKDQDGYFYFVDRNKDRIRRRGENISPSEIEAEIRLHPAVADCVACGYAAPGGEDDIRVFIALRQGTDLAFSAPDLQAFLAGKLPKAMMPRYFEVLENFPLTASGKVDRNAMRASPLPATAWDAEADK
jgi:crotonobetaine/carnitine-CoA ligase